LLNDLLIYSYTYINQHFGKVYMNCVVFYLLFVVALCLQMLQLGTLIFLIGCQIPINMDSDVL